MTNIEFEKIVKDMGVPYTTYTETDFIMDEALAAGTVMTISLRDQLDFCFDSNGNFLGTFTDARYSFIGVEK